jgi:hypothetical protein
MQPCPTNKDGAASTAIAGVRDVLSVYGGEDAAPQVGGVVGLDDALPTVGQSAVPQEKPIASETEVGLVCCGQPVGRGDMA